MPNLNLECFQLSFDVHIVYVNKKTTIFQKLSSQKLANFIRQTRLLRHHLADDVQGVFRQIKMPAFIWDGVWVDLDENEDEIAQKVLAA